MGEGVKNWEQSKEQFGGFANETVPELDRHFRENSQEELAGAAMLEHGWDKHIVALLQVLAQKHSTSVNVGRRSSTLLNIQVVEAEFAIYLHLERKQDEITYSVQVTKSVLKQRP